MAGQHSHPHSNEIRSLDSLVGDDGDTPGIAQELTSDDIDDVAYSPDLSVGERIERLMEMRDEMLAREAGDLEGDMEGLVALVRDRIRMLKSNPVEGDAALESTGMDSSSRSDDDDPADERDEEMD